MTSPDQGRRAYRADRAFDGERFLPDGVLVLVRDGVIEAVEPASTPVPDGWEVDDAPGTTLLPGLVDAHVHLCGDGSPRALDQLPELDDERLGRIVHESAAAQLAVGVTAVRDLGDARWAVVDRRRDLAPLMSVAASGPPITTPDGHCWGMGGEVTGRDALRAAVRERVQRGVDVVKIMATGGFMTAATDVVSVQYGAEDLRAVVDEAHRAGLPVTAHAHALAGVEACLDAGVDGIEHGSFLTVSGVATPPELVDRLAATGIPLCPTLGRRPDLAPPPAVLARMQSLGMTWERLHEHYRALYEGGVRLVCGSDAGINPAKPHGVLPLALVELVELGVPAAAALASATSVAADTCGLSSRTGRLRPGLRADLLVVDGDPQRRITDVTRVRTVVTGGEARAPGRTTSGAGR